MIRYKDIKPRHPDLVHVFLAVGKLMQDFCKEKEKIYEAIPYF